MSGQTHGSKGDKPRPIDRKGWDESKLWENLDKKKEQSHWWQNDTSEIGKIVIDKSTTVTGTFEKKEPKK